MGMRDRTGAEEVPASMLDLSLRARALGYHYRNEARECRKRCNVREVAWG